MRGWIVPGGSGKTVFFPLPLYPWSHLPDRTREANRMNRMARVFTLASGAGILCGATVTPALARSAPDLSGLQLAITAPVLELDDSTVTLTVLFHDGNVRSIALFVD